ncbi:MAG: NAD-dependent epimerase/dehydratase family protein [Lachnospiraceae bacterium]|nr:NAD-dependent epimerase/dehydratase family protein [Lachnospiraceae bacterium]
MKNKYIILGGNGFIGKNLCEYIVRRGHSVTSMDRIFPEQKNPSIEYVQGDFFDDNFLRKIIQDKDVIIHAISTINPGNSNDKFMDGYRNDFVQTINMCSWIKDMDKKVVFLSSGGTVYGDHSNQPLREDVLPQPINHYGNIKLSIENALRIFHIQNRLNISIARISNPYGKGQDFSKGVGFVDAVMKRSLDGKPVEIWGDGGNVRDYIYISDLCECLYQLSLYKGEESVFNVSSGIGISQNEIIDVIRGLGLNVEVTYQEKRSVDVRQIILDNTKIKSLFNLKLTTFDEGVQEYLEYLRQINH